MVQWTNGFTCLCGDASSIPGPAQRVKDPELLLRTSIHCCWGQPKKRREETKKRKAKKRKEMKTLERKERKEVI